jgi:hypothetical protein
MRCFEQPINTAVLARPINTNAVKPAPVGRSTPLPEWQFCIMSKEAFEERWGLLQQLRRQGHMELSDFLGSYAMDPLVQLGLLEETHEPHPYQRYGGHAPTSAGTLYMGYDHRHQLIVVKAGRLNELYACLMHEAQPGWVPAATEDDAFTWRGHPVYDPAVRQQAETQRLIDEGYAPLSDLWTVYRIDVNELIASRFCEYRITDGERMLYTLQPTEMGNAYFYGPPRSGTLLLRPGKGSDLFVACQRVREERLGAVG